MHDDLLTKSIGLSIISPQTDIAAMCPNSIPTALFLSLARHFKHFTYKSPIRTEQVEKKSLIFETRILQLVHKIFVEKYI